MRLVALACVLSGCAVITPGPRHVYQSGPPPRCHPSQYWDGYECRHKGQGYGARKHDGEHHQGHGHDFD